METEAARARPDLACCVILCSDDRDAAAKLQELAHEQRLEKTILSVHPARSPNGLQLAADAEVTAILYRDERVVANRAFRSGELTDSARAALIANLPKIIR